MAKDYSNEKAVKVKKQTKNISLSKKDKRTIKKNIKSFNKTIIVCCFVTLILAVLCGYFVCGVLTKNDCFVMNSYENNMCDISIGTDGDAISYDELGAHCVSFGKEYECNVQYFYRKDISQDVVKVENVDVNVSGIYYVKYTTPSFKYKSITLIRNVIVLEEEV